MQKIIGTIVLLFGMMVLIYSCYYEYPPEPLPVEPQDVSFKTHVLPILTSKCATSECHDGTRIPNLTADHAYNSLKSGGYYNLTFPNESKLYTAVDRGVEGLLMPPSGSLSELDKQLILIWITKGAPND